MNVKGKAAQVLQHQDGEEQITLEGFELLHIKFSTDAHRPQAISSLLLRGEANAVSLGQLAAMTGLGRRAIRRLIQHERREGACICCDNRSGYFLAETGAERDACARSMLSRAREVELTAEAIAAAEVTAGDG